MTRFIIVDVEADMRGNGTPYSTRMSEFAAVDLESGASFYGKLYPGSPWPDNPALSYIPEGAEPYDRLKVFKKFEKWLTQWHDRIVLMSDNIYYDGMMLAVTWDEVMGTRPPWGHSGRRISDIWAGMQAASGNGTWKDTQKWKSFRITKHDHQPLNDCLGNIEGLRHILEMYDQEI